MSFVLISRAMFSGCPPPPLALSALSSTGFPEPVVAVTLTAQSILELRPRYDPPIDVKLAFVGDYAPDTYEGP